MADNNKRENAETMSDIDGHDGERDFPGGGEIANALDHHHAKVRRTCQLAGCDKLAVWLKWQARNAKVTF
jgi:hypothetical protein